MGRLNQKSRFSAWADAKRCARSSKRTPLCGDTGVINLMVDDLAAAANWDEDGTGVKGRRAPVCDLFTDAAARCLRQLNF